MIAGHHSTAPRTPVRRPAAREDARCEWWLGTSGRTALRPTGLLNTVTDHPHRGRDAGFVTGVTAIASLVRPRPRAQAGVRPLTLRVRSRSYAAGHPGPSHRSRCRGGRMDITRSPAQRYRHQLVMHTRQLPLSRSEPAHVSLIARSSRAPTPASSWARATPSITRGLRPAASWVPAAGARGSPPSPRSTPTPDASSGRASCAPSYGGRSDPNSPRAPRGSRPRPVAGALRRSPFRALPAQGHGTRVRSGAAFLRPRQMTATNEWRCAVEKETAPLNIECLEATTIGEGKLAEM